MEGGRREEEEDEMEAGHKAECHQGGTTGSAGHFNLWIHCFSALALEGQFHVINLTKTKNGVRHDVPHSLIELRRSYYISTDLITARRGLWTLCCSSIKQTCMS